MFWYENEIKGLEQGPQRITYEPETIFYGSSSIRMWTSLYTDFEPLKPINLGFGGSTLAACVWFFERVMKPYKPKCLVIYAGDNDLGDNRNPEEVYLFFKQMVATVASRFGNIPCYFISLKPSFSRWDMIDKFKYTNSLIANEIEKLPNWHYINLFAQMLDANGYPRKEYFLTDGLHLSAAGYVLWARAVNEAITAVNT